MFKQSRLLEMQTIKQYFIPLDMKRPGSFILLLFLFLPALNFRMTSAPSARPYKTDSPPVQNFKPSIHSMNGESPSLYVADGRIHIVFVTGDSIFYAYSTNRGRSFTVPSVVAVLQGLIHAGGRGPQITGTNGELVIAAPDKSGNFYTYLKDKTDNRWKKGARINDVTNTAKEGFISLAANFRGDIFAVWLDLRDGGRNNIYGSASKDGGKTWMKNRLIYKSPDGSVCECCKPAIAMKEQQVAVMFRNNLKGNRDLYLIQSKDGGTTFGTAQKLGQGSWKINGCPMDGGGLVIDSSGKIQTVWRREDNIYTDRPGEREVLVGMGMKCTIDNTNGGSYVLYLYQGKTYCHKPDGSKIELGPGAGYPTMKSLDKSSILCAWEYNKKIYSAILN